MDSASKMWNKLATLGVNLLTSCRYSGI